MLGQTFKYANTHHGLICVFPASSQMYACVRVKLVDLTLLHSYYHKMPMAA